MSGDPLCWGGDRLHGTHYLPSICTRRKALSICATQQYGVSTALLPPHSPSRPPSRAPLQPQGIVQGDQLAQEPPVRDDTTVVLDRLYGFYEGHVVADHEVGEDQGGRPAHPDSTVHKDPPFIQRLMDEVSCRIEVGAHVKGRRVVGLDAQVADARPLVVLRTPSPFAVRGIEDVGDAQVSQLTPVGRYILISQVESRPDLISMVTGCLPCVQQPFELEDAEDGVVAAFLPHTPTR